MNIWRTRTLRRLALPLAVVSLGAALTSGWGQSLASSAPTSDPNVPDPEVTSQSIILVLAPHNDDNFKAENACGGAPSTQPVAGVEKGTWSAPKLSVSQNRCTLAIFVPTQKPADLKYSTTPCGVDAFPVATNPTSVGLAFQTLKSPSTLKECTAPGFLASVNTLLTSATGAAGVQAIHDFPGAGCKPSQCRLFMELVAKDGEFNAPGLCAAAFYITGPCTAAVIDTGGVAAHPGGAHLNLSDNRCPTESNLSLPPIGDISESCTNLPFKPADMSITLPPGMTANPELQTPAAALPQHSTELSDQAITYDLSPVNQFTSDPPNACSIDGIKPVNRCTAAIIKLPVGFAGGNVDFPASRCVLDTSESKGHGNGQGNPCFAQPFSPSKGTTAIHNLPPITCHAAEPAAAVGGVLPVVACQIYVVLTRDDGDYNANNPCGVLSNATTSVNSPCLLMSARTTEHHEGDDISLTKTTPFCVSGGAAAPNGVDADVTTDCVAAGNAPTTAVAFTPAAGSLGALLALGTPASVTVHIPEDPVLGSNQ